MLYNIIVKYFSFFNFISQISTYAFFTQNNPKKLSVIEIFSIFAK